MISIQSKIHLYSVEVFPDLFGALSACEETGGFWLVDRKVFDLYKSSFVPKVPTERIYFIEATEGQKSFEALTPIFVWLLEKGLRRDGRLVVVGGGVLQDIGCFIASVLFRGIRWELIPTTLLAQCDSCIGSKSSINIHSYKNQIGTFYPPNRICLTYDVLKSLPWDEIRSGLGEVIKLHLLTGEKEYSSLMADLESLKTHMAVLPRWIVSSLQIKKAYIEQDEYDKGIRNLLNYGHTFGHAYESATRYSIPHGIAVTLGMLTATYISARLGFVSRQYFEELKGALYSWHHPYEEELVKADFAAIMAAIKLDKKNTKDSINCILTRGPGKMEKAAISLDQQLRPFISDFIRENC